MLALAVPVSAGWLQGIWIWPQDLYVFRPVFCVLVGGYAFMVLRNLDGVGFRLVWRRRDISYALLNLLAFTLLAIPIGIGLGFIHPHSAAALSRFGGLGLAGNFFFLFIGIYLTVAIPEELLFRGILQNILVRSIHKGPPGLYGLLIASVVFGASHLHHAPVPNWRYAILATLAGIVLRKCLPHPAAPVRIRPDPRVGGYLMALLVLTVSGLAVASAAAECPCRAGFSAYPRPNRSRIRLDAQSKAQ